MSADIYIRDMPSDIRERAHRNQRKQNNVPTEELPVKADKYAGNFEWEDTPEGWAFWHLCSLGMYTEARKVHGQQQLRVTSVKIWAIVLFLAALMFIILRYGW